MDAEVSRWLQTAIEAPGGVAPTVALVRLGLAFGMGWLIALVYRWTHDGEPYPPTFPPTLTLLAILIAATTQVIGDNVARAFSLVGALSVVRFRTVVRDTRDTAFVIFAVVVGMSIGSAHLWIAVVTLLIGGASAALQRPRARRGAGALERGTAAFRLVLRVASGVRPVAILEGISEEHLISCQTIAVATTRGGAALEATFEAVLRDESAAASLVEALNGVEGVQGVELRRADWNGAD